MEPDKKDEAGAGRSGRLALLSWIMPLVYAALFTVLIFIPELDVDIAIDYTIGGFVLALLGLGFAIAGFWSRRKASAVIGLLLNLGIVGGLVFFLLILGQGLAGVAVPR